MGSRVRLLLPLLLVAFAAPALMARQDGVKKSMFVSVLDASGRPVRDFTAADIAIREDGQDRTVVEVKPASKPISVALLIDTAQGKRVSDAYGSIEEYARDIRVGAAAFMEQLTTLAPESQVSLWEFAQAATVIQKYTSDLAEFQKAVTKLAPRPNVGSVLGEALAAAGQDLAKRETPRRAIVSVNLEPSDDQSVETAAPIRDALRKSGAQVWALSVQRGALTNSTKGVVLNDFAKMSGGHHEFITDISAVTNILKAFANALAMQYEVVYLRPSSAKGAKVIQTGTAHDGMQIHASIFPPQ